MGFRKLVILLIAALVTTLLSSCNQGSEEIVAFTYVNLIPMNSERTIENQTVLVKGVKNYRYWRFRYHANSQRVYYVKGTTL